MLTTHYTFSKNNKEDVKFLKLVYDFCKENYIIPSENKYVVVGHSVMEIKQALVNITNYHIKHLDGKYRQHVERKENYTNAYSNSESVIAVSVPGYVSLGRELLTSEYKNIIKCIGNTWAPYMYKNNTERKRNLENADIYLMSGRYLLGNPHQLKSLHKYSIKLSFGFIKDEKLANSIQDQINHISAGFEYSNMKVAKSILLKPDTIRSAYKENYNILRKGVHTITKVIKKYNHKYEDYKVKYEVEPSRFYMYITSNEKFNIKKFTSYYNKLNLEYKLYVNSEDLRRAYQSIWVPRFPSGTAVITNFKQF
jgi:hypothetical protein